MKINNEWMKGLNGDVRNVSRTYRSTGVSNPLGMPISAWRSSKPSSVQVEPMMSTDSYFGRNAQQLGKTSSVTIDVTSQNKFTEDKNRFHVAISPILMMAQCFAVLPVSGIQSSDSSDLKFTWKSFKIIYSGISFIGAAILVTFSAIRVYITGITPTKTTNVVFFGAACVTILLFLRLATRWPCLIRIWDKTEREMTTPQPTSTRMRLKTRLAIISIITMSLALVEHLLSIGSGYASALECAFLRGDDNILSTYFQSQFPQVFDLTTWNWWKSLLVLCMNIISTFSWNFMDLFLMLISTALAERFRQLNDRLYSIRGKYCFVVKAMPDWWWAEAREDYNRLANLTRRVDSCISDIVLFSFGTNLYFICIQLLNSLKPRRGILQTIYTNFSFAFLIARTAAVSLYAASINDQSLRPTPVLYSVSAASYSTEVQRFLIQTTTDRIGLTGLSFFSITRGLILTVAGTIVTYELVLVQFNAMQTVDSTIVNITNACEVK